MKCNDIQERLSAYIEGIISAEEKKLIDKHLTSCQKCSQSFTDLRKTIEYVHNLEDVEPPAWLVQETMARVRTEARPQKGIMQKLFYPLHIKLPIEAVAVILIAFTAFYMFKSSQPEMRLAKAPSKHEIVIARSPESRPESRRLSGRDDKAISKDKIASPLARNDSKKLRSHEQPMLLKETELKDKYAEVPEAPASLAKQDHVMPSAGIGAKDESNSEALSRAPKEKTFAGRKEEIISLTIHVKDIDTAGKEIENILTQLKGKIMKTESFENISTITAEIGSEKIEELFKKLELIGKIEGESVLKSLEGKLTVTIEIVK